MSATRAGATFMRLQCRRGVAPSGDDRPNRAIALVPIAITGKNAAQDKIAIKGHKTVGTGMAGPAMAATKTRATIDAACTQGAVTVALDNAGTSPMENPSNLWICMARLTLQPGLKV